MTDERMAAFLRSVRPELPPYLASVGTEARREFVPIIKEEAQSLIMTLITALAPQNILEIGTAVGFSALLMREYAPRGCHITTIESSGKRAKAARGHFRDAGAEEDITLVEDDALAVLPSLTDTYDFIFLDGAKGQYITMLDDLIRLLGEGGVLVSDNVLQEGDILESRYVIRQRDRTIHTRMREYLHALTHTDCLCTSVLSAGDGITVSVKRREKQCSVTGKELR